MCLEVGAGRGTRTHTPAKVADFKSRQAGGPGTGSQRNAELIARFVNNRRARGLTTTTCQYYFGYLSRFVAEVGQPLLTITNDALAQHLFNLHCGPGGKQAYLRALRAFYFWAEERGLVAANPCNRLRIKVPKPLRPMVKVSDIPRLLDSCDSTRDKLVVAMLADTGLRLTELASVRPVDVDLERSIITVWGKGAKQRVVRYGPMTEELLLKWLNERPNTNGLLPMPARGISSMLYRLQTQTGIRCNAHAFRRTFATESVRNGLNVFYVQSLLGHSSLTMTRIYAEQVSSEDAIKAYKPIVT